MNSIIAADLIASVYAEEHDPIQVGDLEATIVNMDGTWFLAVGGSDETEDWIRNIRTMPWWSSELGCFCHAGFYKSARKAYPKVSRILSGARNIVVCGHSKGGAEATILAAMLRVVGYRVSELITFGSPRCGFGGLADRLGDVKMIRYVNGGDPVPALPPAFPLILRYRHVCEETRLTHPNNPGFIGDHMLPAYRRALDLHKSG